MRLSIISAEMVRVSCWQIARKKRLHPDRYKGYRHGDLRSLRPSSEYTPTSGDTPVGALNASVGCESIEVPEYHLLLIGFPKWPQRVDHQRIRHADDQQGPAARAGPGPRLSPHRSRPSPARHWPTAQWAQRCPRPSGPGTATNLAGAGAAVAPSGEVAMPALSSGSASSIVGP
jgi:hypothetical protein